MAELNMGNLYDFNKEAIKNIKVLKKEELDEKLNSLCTFMMTNKYNMLLCKERADYSIFKMCSGNLDQVKKETRETLENRGRIVAIDKTSDDLAYEIWIRDFNTIDTVLYFLFSYDNAIIEC